RPACLVGTSRRARRPAPGVADLGGSADNRSHASMAPLARLHPLREDTAMTESAELPRAKPRLFHTPSSYYSMIARLALAEGGVVYEPVFVDIHFRMSQQRPGYVRLNPNMTVPTLVLADRILDQSRDIAERALGVDEATLGGEARAWLDLHYAYPIEQLTF